MINDNVIMEIRLPIKYLYQEMISIAI